jgi:hypothetical protein
VLHEVHDPFGDGELKSNACLNWSSSAADVYIDGYRRAAGELINYACRELRDRDTLIYPILFLYRHHFELVLKETLWKAQVLLDIDSEPDLHHNILKLWQRFKPIVHTLPGGDNQESKERIREGQEILQWFCRVDKDSEAFRYPRDRRGKHSVPGIRILNLEKIREKCEALANFLAGCRCAVDEHFDWAAESQRP